MHISELLDPTPWLSGGELLLTTGMQLDTAEQAAGVRRRGSPTTIWPDSGSGPASGTPRCPAALLEVAAEREFPVFEVPYELPFIAITEAAFTQLVNEQYAVLRRALAAQERLERIVLSERGLEALVGALATLVGAAVLVFDARGEPLQQHAFRRAIEPEALEALRERGARAGPPARGAGVHALAGRGQPGPGAAGRRRRRAPAGATAVIAARGGPCPSPEAWLVAIKDAGPLSDFDRLTLHQAVTIVALELLRARVAGDTERRLAGDVLDAIVSGELTGSELARRLGPFGLSDRVGGDRAERATSGRGLARRPLEAALWAALREEAAPALVASVGHARLRAGRRAGPTTSCSRSASAWPRRPARSWPARCASGIGRAVPTVDARRSFHEARCALEALALG